MIGQVTDIKDILEAPVKEMASFQQKVSKLMTEIARLNRLLSKYQKDLHKARVEIADLKKRLAENTKPDKDSHNSSVPPSQDSLKSQAIRRTKSLRQKSRRNVGGGSQGTKDAH